jgi:hypothetical protein
MSELLTDLPRSQDAPHGGPLGVGIALAFPALGILLGGIGVGAVSRIQIPPTPNASVLANDSTFTSWLVWLGITRHERCIGCAAGLAVSCRLVIPSLTSRPGRHPFAELAHPMNASSDAAALMPAPDARCDRAINDKFVLQPAARLEGQHVLILDDVWTTGSNAQ